MTRFGRSTGLPSARRRARQRRLSASPPSIAASLEPVVEHPVTTFGSAACQRLLRMLTHRISRSAVCGYSSLSIMFLSKHSAISCVASGSIHVLTNVARLRRALPSSISSSCTIWYATSGGSSSAGSSCRGRRRLSRSKSGASDRSSDSEAGPSGCFSAIVRHPSGARRRPHHPIRVTCGARPLSRTARPRASSAPRGSPRAPWPRPRARRGRANGRPRRGSARPRPG